MDCSNKGLTKSQKDFVGTKFEIPKGGVLTVTGVIGKDKKGPAIFSLWCSICSIDSELWSAGSISSVKGNLLRGKAPCGCSKNPRWTEEQFRIRVKRECDKRGYTFNGWVNGGFKDNSTKLDLFNPATKNSWQSTSINNFFQGSGDPAEAVEDIRQARLKDDSVHIQAFIAAGFDEENYSFWRSDRRNGRGKKNYWYYFCPKCSKDEYVKAGLCSGVFESHGGDLKKGHKSCRCSDKYQWKPEHREYQIRKLCDSEKLNFVGWTEEKGYKNNTSKFSWVCSKGHECVTDVGNFLNKEARCNTCRKETSRFYGYYPDQLDRPDSLYVLSDPDKDDHIKVGRTFIDAKNDRIRSINWESGSNYTQLIKVVGKHGDIYEMEQRILNSDRLPRHKSETKFAGSGELLKSGCTEVLLQGIRDFVSVKPDLYSIELDKPLSLKP